MLLVLFNAQPVIFLMEKFVNLFLKTVLQVNSTMLKLVNALLAHIHAHNVNLLTTSVPLVHQASLLVPTNVLNQTVVDQENSELHQVHAQLVLKNVLIVLVPLIVLPVLMVIFTTELIVF